MLFLRAGDRPKTKNRRSSWQRLCVVCAEPYAMNGFWRKHGGCNIKGVCLPLETRSQAHQRSMRTNFKTMADVARYVASLAKHRAKKMNALPFFSKYVSF